MLDRQVVFFFFIIFYRVGRSIRQYNNIIAMQVILFRDSRDRRQYGLNYCIVRFACLLRIEYAISPLLLNNKKRTGREIIDVPAIQFHCMLSGIKYNFRFQFPWACIRVYPNQESWTLYAVHGILQNNRAVASHFTSKAFKSRAIKFIGNRGFT